MEETKAKRHEYHPEIEAFLKSIPKMVQDAKASNDFLYFIDRIRKEFSANYSSGCTYAGIKFWEAHFYFEKFSDAKRLLKFLAENGHRRKGKARELKEAQTIVWEFEKIKVFGHFNGTGTACKYVKTGTIMVAQDVFELQCPEVIDPQFAAAVAEVDGDGIPL